MVIHTEYCSLPCRFLFKIKLIGKGERFCSYQLSFLFAWGSFVFTHKWKERAINGNKEKCKSQELWEKMKSQDWRALGAGLNGKSKQKKRGKLFKPKENLRFETKYNIYTCVCVTFIVLKDKKKKSLKALKIT